MNDFGQNGAFVRKTRRRGGLAKKSPDLGPGFIFDCFAILLEFESPGYAESASAERNSLEPAKAATNAANPC